MDRLNRTLVGCGLALTLILPNAGCRSTRSEVPKGRSYSGDGQQAPPIGFSQSANPDSYSGLQTGQGGLPGSPGGSPLLGTPSPAAPNYGVPTGPGFGGPGSAGMTTPPAAVTDPSVGIPQTGTGSTGPAAGIGVGAPK